MNRARPRLPRGLRLLGWSGTLPFIAAVGVAAVDPNLRPVALMAFIAYGAMILSFLGGTRWGSGLAGGSPPPRFVKSVTPSLLAFAALLLVHAPAWSLSLLALGFLVWALIDIADPGWPDAYRRMRLGITVLVLALHASWILV